MEEHKFTVLDDPDCTRDWIQLPIAYDRAKRQPWTLIPMVFRTPQLCLRFAYEHPIVLPATQIHLVRQMFALRHGILDQIQPSPPMQVMRRYQANGRGLTDEQMLGTALFPEVIFTWARWPRKSAAFPDEMFAFREKNSRLLRYWSHHGIPDEIVRKLWVNEKGESVKSIAIDGDPDSDAETDFMPIHYGQEKKANESPNESNDEKDVCRDDEKGSRPQEMDVDRLLESKKSIKKSMKKGQHRSSSSESDSSSSSESDTDEKPVQPRKPKQKQTTQQTKHKQTQQQKPRQPQQKGKKIVRFTKD